MDVRRTCHLQKHLELSQSILALSDDDVRCLIDEAVDRLSGVLFDVPILTPLVPVAHFLVQKVQEQKRILIVVCVLPDMGQPQKPVQNRGFRIDEPHLYLVRGVVPRKVEDDSFFGYGLSAPGRPADHDMSFLPDPGIDFVISHSVLPSFFDVL